MTDRPYARREALVYESVDGQLVIYDELTQVAHSLSSAATLVWEACDGEHTVEEIASERGLTTDMVLRAIAELDTCGLLDHGPTPGYSRRDAAKRIAQVGGAAFAAPLIYSVAIAPAMAAASCAADGTSQTIFPTADPQCPATTPGQKAADASCCSGFCYTDDAATATCASAACGGINTACTSGTQCCSGTCTANFCVTNGP